MKSIILFIFMIAILSGCSSKQYYVPEKNIIYGLDKEVLTASDYIVNINAIGATTKSNRIINKDGISELVLPNGYEYLNDSENGILAANKDGDVWISDQNLTINFRANPIAATLQDNLLALVFNDNSYGVYDVKEGKLKFKEYLDKSYVNDTRIAAPVILNKIILFPMLDGKIVIVDKEKFITSRTILVDPQNEIKNIILLKTVGDTLIAASGNKIVSLHKGKYGTKEVSIKNYFVDENNIYLTLLDGTVMKLDFDLNILQSKKFKFAKFHAISKDKEGNLYLLEAEGYMIRLSNDFKETKVYDFSFYDDEKVYTNGSKIYFENKLFKLD
jgi:hypothetical protein